MRSKMFSKVDVSEKRSFARDIRALVELPGSVLAELPEYGRRFTLAASDVESMSIVDAASEATGILRSKLFYALRLSFFFLRGFTRLGDGSSDSPEAVLADMEEFFDVPGDRRPDLLRYLGDIKELAEPAIADVLIRRSYASRALPTLESVSSVLDLRVVFDPEYLRGDRLESYLPKCLGAVPVAIIRLGFDTEEHPGAHFQVDRKWLRFLIDALRSIEKEMEIAESSFELHETDTAA